jgi:uncharacterized membrane protein SirB2
MTDASSLFVIMKSIHMITLTITVTGFILRSIWMLRDSPLLQARLVKTLPHVNDTILFVSAVWTAALLGQYPFVDAWLTAKVFGALAYIILGAIALTYGKTRQIRSMAFVGALLCFAYVVAVAITKNPLIF